jgi:hypothetical protein
MTLADAFAVGNVVNFEQRKSRSLAMLQCGILFYGIKCSRVERSARALEANISLYSVYGAYALEASDGFGRRIQTF